MEYVKIIVQLFCIGFIIYFISGRLIGTKLNFFKRFFAASFSVVMTTFVYWYSYLRHTNFKIHDTLSEMTNISTLIWIGSMLLITMLIYLMLELFDPKQMGQIRSNDEHFLKKIRGSYYRKKRLFQVFRIAFRQGVGKAFQYKRSYENDRFIANALRNMLEEAGGIFIKFGQVLSTRKDIFSPIFIEELSKLQRSVKPMTEQEVIDTLQMSLSLPKDVIFSHFDLKPLAAGSIGQVHRATLAKENKEVVVKILRPDVAALMVNDLDILLHFSTWLVEQSTWAEKLGFNQLAMGFANNLREEIDFTIEARNTLQIKNALSNAYNEIDFPDIYLKYSNEKILVIDYIDGEPLLEAQTILRQKGISKHETLSKVYMSFLEQLLVTGIFHADPHPGNVYIRAENGQPVFLDFGAVGRLGPLQKKGMRTLLIGLARNEPTILMDGMRSLVEDADLHDEENLAQDLSQLLVSLSFLEKVSTEEFVQSLFLIVRNHELKLYPMVGVALRALITIEGTVTSFESQFDLINEARNFTEQRKADFMSFKSFNDVKDAVTQEAIMILPQIQEFPRRFDRILQKIEKGEATVKMELFSNEKNVAILSYWLSHFILLAVAITFSIVSVSLLAIAQFIKGEYAVYLNTASFCGLFLSAVILVRVSVQALRNSRKLL